MAFPPIVHPLARFTSDLPQHRSEFVIAPDREGDPVLEVSVTYDGDGPSVALRPAKARQIAAELIARADRIDAQAVTP